LLAEDLGVANPEVTELLEKAGYPGMKVLLFAFGDNAKNPYLPHMHTPNAICYVGTHDNETLVGFCKDPNHAAAVNNAITYFNLNDVSKLPAAFRRAALFSVCNTAIISMNDWLELPATTRINTPGTNQGNWQWRLESWQLTQNLTVEMRRLTELSGR